MKKSIILALSALLMLVVLPERAYATYGNDYLEKNYHYYMYATGMDKVHFVIPVLSHYSMWTSYMAIPESYITYTLKGGSETTLLHFCSALTPENENGDMKGQAQMKFEPNHGERYDVTGKS